MKGGTTIRQGEIILIDVPYSDLSKTKKRPVLVVSNKSLNSHSEDFICCGLTSNPKDKINSIIVREEDLDKGELKYKSRINPDKVFTLNQKKILRTIGILNIVKTKQTIKKLNKLVEIEP